MTVFNQSADIIWLAGMQCAQVGVLFVTMWCVCRWLLADRPYLAHGLWVLLLIKCLTPPVWSSEVGVFSWVHYQPVERVPVGEAVDSMGTVVHDPRLIREMKERASARPEAAPLRRTNSDPVASSLSGDQFRNVHGPSVHWPVILLAIWMFGALAVCAATLGRFFIYRRRIWESAIAHDENWDEYLEALRTRLRVRRRVRLVLTRERVGPAVFGLLRPTIVLPEEVVESRSASELEPILAHELIHVRRGDLWIGVLQLFAGAAWWFYPPVWIAIRRVCRMSEECCDLAVINHLPHARRAYADLLLDVLARGQELRAIPLVHGVKSADITFKRMERIMNVRTKPGRWTVCVRWAVLLGMAVVALPGAAWEKEGENQGKKRPVKEEARDADPVDRRVTDETQLVIAYVISDADAESAWDVYDNFEEVGFNRRGAQQALKDLVKSQAFEFPCADVTRLYDPEDPKAGPEASFIGASRTSPLVKFDKDHMLVRGTRSLHEKVERMIKAFSDTGLAMTRLWITTGWIKNSTLASVGDWKNDGKYTELVVTEQSDSLDTEIKTAGELQYAILDMEEWESMKNSVFDTTVADIAKNVRHVSSTSPNGASSNRFAIASHQLALPSAKKVWLVSEGYEFASCVTLTSEQRNTNGEEPSDEKNFDSALLNLDYHYTDGPTESDAMIAGEDGKRRARQVHRISGRIDVSVELGKTILVRHERRQVPPNKEGSTQVLAITVEQFPFEVWRRVGSDEFRIEPAE